MSGKKILFGLLVVVVVLSITTLCVVGGLMLGHAADTENLPGYNLRNCTLKKSTVATFPGCYYAISKPQSAYIAVWEDSERGTSVISSPYSSTTKFAEAKSHLDDYQFNVSLPCMCNPDLELEYPRFNDILNCNVWGACILDVKLVQAFQRNGGRSRMVGAVLISVGLGLIGIVSIGYVIMRCCKWGPFVDYDELDDSDF